MTNHPDLSEPTAQVDVLLVGVELAERALEVRRHEADSIREALRDAHDALRRARVGLGALAAIERDEAREAESASG